MVYHHWCTSQKDWRLFQNMNKYEGKNWQDWGGQSIDQCISLEFMECFLSAMSTTICAHYLTHITYPILSISCVGDWWVGHSVTSQLIFNQVPSMMPSMINLVTSCSKKKVRCLVLGHSMSLCVALCYSDPCFPHVSLMFASWVYRVCCQNQPNHSCCGTPASAASLMEDSISSAHVMTVIPLLSTFHSCSSCGS